MKIDNDKGFRFKSLWQRKVNHFEIPVKLVFSSSMDNLREQFEVAVKEVEMLRDRPSNDSLLALYSLYKQAKEGDNNNPPPENPFDFVAKAKYDAWLSQLGKSKETAMGEYIELVEKLKN
jgi:acyl-CoA-binding protein